MTTVKTDTSVLHTFNLPEVTNIGDHGEINYLLCFLEEAIDRIIANETSVAEMKLNITLAKDALQSILPDLLSAHFSKTF
jgi:hypothetical protein